MGVYLPNMEMPTKGYHLILVHDDGTVQTTSGETTAVFVPPHGRLIDVDALISNHTIDKYDCSEVISIEDIRNAPTFIEAEEGET